jgi:hypothetical protein
MGTGLVVHFEEIHPPISAKQLFIRGDRWAIMQP